MSATERMQKLLAANPRQLSKIDAILNGDETAKVKAEDLRTCTLMEAAKMLNVSRPSIYRMVESGKLRTVKICDVRRIVVASISELVNGNAEG